ncbi:MAG TPA: MraY family glycosyltransferase [Phycisphaerae bacterium]|nr:MraY family glycosyltransferase [Phycisphaerae bacterium]
MTRETLPVFVLVVAGVLSAAGTWLVRRWSLAKGFVDRPGGHKGHAKPVALGGGVAVTLAICLPILAGVLAARMFVSEPPGWFPADLAPHLRGIVAKTPLALGIVGAALVMCVMGLVDDARPLGAGVKFLIQLAVTVALVAGFDLRLLSHLAWPVSAGLSVLWLLTLTNSFNFLDNMDGLAAGVAAVAAAVFATTAMHTGQIFVPVCCWLLVGALVGFLPYNFHPASIFMGDAGSQVIGLLVAVFTILTTFADPSQGQRPIGVIAPLVVMAVPLYDTISVCVLRWRLGVPIWKGDRRHFSHRLVSRGMGVRRAVLVIWLATLVTAMPALLLPTATWPLAIGVLLHTFLVVLLVALLESSGSLE